MNGMVPSKYALWLLVSLSLLISFDVAIAASSNTVPASAALGSPQDSTLSNVLSALGFWGAFLSIVVGILSVAITVAVGLSVFQYTHSRKATQDLVRSTEEQLQRLTAKYQLEKMQTPEEILTKARSELLLNIAALRERLDAHDRSHEKQIDRIRTDTLRKVLNAFLVLNEMKSGERREAVTQALAVDRASLTVKERAEGP